MSFRGFGLRPALITLLALRVSVEASRHRACCQDQTSAGRASRRPSGNLRRRAAVDVQAAPADKRPSTTPRCHHVAARHERAHQSAVWRGRSCVPLGRGWRLLLGEAVVRTLAGCSRVGAGRGVGVLGPIGQLTVGPCLSADDERPRGRSKRRMRPWAESSCSSRFVPRRSRRGRHDSA